MASPFVRKLSSYASLSPADLALLEEEAGPTSTYAAHRDLIQEGDPPNRVFVIQEGWACRYKVLPDGSRQIIAFMMPGDFCDAHVSELDEMDHSIGALTDCRVATIARDRMDALLCATPALTHAFWRAQLIDEGILRAWIVGLGRRNAAARVAHLLLELSIRMRNVGLVTREQFDLPLTQTILADALGLTPVHTNRTLQALRKGGVMTLNHGTLTIIDLKRLVRIGSFDENYLHKRKVV